jgi:signal recognition particle receptor subunit beta
VNYKVIITGPVGSGKTTAVNSLTNKNAMLTDVAVSNSDQITKQRKQTTTVAMDYDVVRLDNNDIVHVYGTPGQERFDFMWDILSKGADGIILLLDNTRNYPFRDLKYYTKRFSNIIGSAHLVVAVTRFDLNQDPPLAAYRQWLKTLNLKADVIAIDARKKTDVTALFHALLNIPQKTTIESPEQQPTITNDTHNSVSTSNAPIEDKDLIPVVPSSTNDNEVEQYFTEEENINLTVSILPKIAKVAGVTGVTLTNSMGELLDSTINDEELNEFLAFLSGVSNEIENKLNRGKIYRIMLRSPHDDNLTLFVERDKSLGISSERIKSIQALSQQIEDMLQWM